MLVSRACLRVVSLVACIVWPGLPAWSGAVVRPNGASAMPVFTRSISARAEISGQFARTTLVMVFQNESEDQIEADLIYALPPGAVATYFAYWAGDEKIEAKIVEKKEAARIYEHLTSYTRDPALVEFTGRNTFRARISPIFADQDLKVEIRYVQVLQSSGDSVSYSAPIGPASKQVDPLESVDAMVRIDGDNRVVSVSNNYGVPAATESGDYRVVIKGEDYRPPKDLTVRILRKHSPLRAELRAEPGNGHFSLALTPDHSLKRPRVSISGVRVTQIAPARLPNVRAGQVLVISGRYSSGGKAVVALTGQSSSGRKTYKAPIDFSAVSTSGIAPKLWALARMADLGRKRANRKAVVNLSFSYSLPSRYTSWLAVPKAETKTLEYEKVEDKLHELASQMAEMIATGKQDSPEYRSIKRKYEELRKPFSERGGGGELAYEVWQKRSEAVQKVIELRKAGKPDAAAEAMWKARAERLSQEMRRIDPEYQQDSVDAELAQHERWETESQCRTLADKLLKLIEAGKGSTDEAKNLRADYLRLRERLPKDGNGGPDPLVNWARWRTGSLAYQIVNARHQPKPDRTRLSDLQSRIERTAAAANLTPDEEIKKADANWVANKRADLARVYVNALAEGKTKEAASHLVSYNELSKTVGAQDARKLIDLELANRCSNAAWDYYWAKRYRSEKPVELRRLRERAQRLAKLAGSSLEKSIKEFAEEDAASDASDQLYDTARSLASELGHQHPIRSRVERLRESTGTMASELKRIGLKYHHSKSADDYNVAADQAIAAWLEEQKVKAQAQAGNAGQDELKKAAEKRTAAQENLRTNLYHIRGSVRGGDPLISVEAPEDALRVLALLPDGDVKLLVWNPANRRWEARFDIPTGTPDGDYVVEVVVMLSDGARKHSSVNYRVDNTPPSGLASAVVCSDARGLLRLEVRPGEEIARIVALLPWGERVELRKSSEGDGYIAVVPVPVMATLGKIEFVLTDNAHNRASVFADAKAP